MVMALDRLKNIRPLAEAVGLMLVGRAQSSFRDQGRPGFPWAGRGVPNKAGILLDLIQGKEPPERRFEARPAGIDTGRLRASIAYKVDGDVVTIGSNLPYASDVQRGATKTIAVAGNARQALAAWLKTLKGERKKSMQKAFGYLFRVGALTVTTPPRPFVMITDEDRRKVQDMARAYFQGGGWRK